MNKKWCCDAFEHTFDQRHGRTIYVIAEPPSHASKFPSFWIAMSSVTSSDRAALSNGVIPDLGFPITIGTRVPIQHCPWCGRNLLKFYGLTPEHLYDESIEESQP